MAEAVLWEERGWVDMEAYLREDDRALLPVGSCEQHGRHLSFATDYLIPTEIARRVSARTRVPVAPTLCFGMSVHHMEFPGTITLGADTFVLVVRDILESLHRHGFRRVMILNGHGGNVAPITIALAPLLDRHRDLRVKVGHWWQDPAVQGVLRELFGDVEYHAAVGETSAIMAIRPGIPKMERAAHSPFAGGMEAMGPRHWKAFFPHGAAGVDPKRASPEVGERLIQAAVDRFTRELQDWPDL
ncbi:MAG TPA: creatininase family protein [bacterium]|nr:creatininase family protein [bacterium]